MRQDRKFYFQPHLQTRVAGLVLRGMRHAPTFRLQPRRPVPGPPFSALHRTQARPMPCITSSPILRTSSYKTAAAQNHCARIRRRDPGLGQLLSLLGSRAQVRPVRIRRSTPNHIGQHPTSWNNAYTGPVLQVPKVRTFVSRVQRTVPYQADHGKMATSMLVVQRQRPLPILLPRETCDKEPMVDVLPGRHPFEGYHPKAKTVRNLG